MDLIYGNFRKLAQYSSARPAEERTPQTIGLRSKPFDQRRKDLTDLYARTTVLQSKQGCREIAHARQLALAIARFIDQKVSNMGLIHREGCGSWLDQWCELVGRAPSRRAVVQDDRQHRWKLAFRRKGLRVDELLIEQPHVR